MATSPEVLLISAVVRQQDHVTPAARGITKALFHAYVDEWEWIEDYISRYHRAPSKGAFLQKFPTFSLKQVDDVNHFCEEVKSNHAQTALQSALQETIDALKNGDVRGALKKIHASALDVESRMDGASHDADIIQNWGDVYSEVERRVARAAEFGMAGVPTGFPTLDERTGGPQPGHLWVVAARLGQGKTWSLVRMAVAACFSGLSIQYNALEQSRAEIAMRVHTFMSSEYGQEVFRNLDLAQGRNFSVVEYKRFLTDMQARIAGKFHVSDTTRGRVSPMTIAAQIERNRPDAVFLDYLTLMDTGNSDDWKGIAKLSAGLKQVATQYGVPIIAAAQLNRSAATGGREIAGPEALAESDAIGRDADAIVTMKALSRTVIAMRLAKYRHGRDGFTWYTKFTPNTGHFEEVTFDEAQDAIADDKDSENEDNPSFKPRQKGSFDEIAKRRVSSKNTTSKTSARKVIRRSN